MEEESTIYWIWTDVEKDKSLHFVPYYFSTQAYILAFPNLSLIPPPHPSYLFSFLSLFSFPNRFPSLFSLS